jgi:ribosome-binding factor A
MGKTSLHITKREGSNRKLRVAEGIKRAVSDVLNNDKVLAHLTADQSYTITKVDVSPDLRNIKIYVVPFGAANSDDYILILNNNAALVRKFLLAKLDLRHAPVLKFIYDHSFDDAKRINSLLDQIS